MFAAHSRGRTIVMVGGYRSVSVCVLCADIPSPAHYPPRPCSLPERPQTLGAWSSCGCKSQMVGLPSLLACNSS